MTSESELAALHLLNFRSKRKQSDCRQVSQSSSSVGVWLQSQDASAKSSGAKNKTKWTEGPSSAAEVTVRTIRTEVSSSGFNSQTTQEAQTKLPCSEAAWREVAVQGR